MTHAPRKWTSEALHHLDPDAADLDSLREAVSALEGKLCKAREAGERNRELERDLARAETSLRRRERRLLG